VKSVLRKTGGLKKSHFSRPQLLVFVLAFAVIGYILVRAFAAGNPNLPGDLNNDNKVDITDMSILLSNYGTTNASADVNSDGQVNVLDMSILLSNYGKTYTTASFTTSVTSGMTITPPYTWTFNPGVASVKGYFWADGVLLSTASPDANGTYTFVIQPSTLTAGSHTLGHAWDLADGTHHSPSQSYPVTVNSTTPPPPPTGTIYFDGRAKNMISLSSTGWYPTNLVQSQDPAGFWDGLTFDNNSITLQPDSTFGKIYKYVIGPGNRNPYNTGAPTNDASGELSKRHPGNALGTTDYYAFAVMVPSPGWYNPDWSDFITFGYQTAAWDANAISVQPNASNTPAWTFYGNAGYINCPTTTCSGTANHGYNYFMPVTYNQWTEFAVAIKWSTTMTGSIKIYSRPINGTWKQYLDLENTDTLLYGTSSYGTFPQNYTDGWLDKLDLYYGYWNSATTSFPTETIYHSGFVRASDLQTAQSTLP